MYNVKTPSLNELPSSEQLLRSTVIAAITAAVILVTIVLPAEYAIDPTGIGRALNLTQMGEIKQQLGHEAEPKQAVVAAQQVVEVPKQAVDIPVQSAQITQPEAEATKTYVPNWRDETSLTLAPGQGAEIKLEMRKGAKAIYAWVAEGGPVNFDKHGEDNGGKFIRYEKKLNTSEDQGELVAEFDGVHGWFWRNRGDGNATIILRTKGEYSAVKKM